MQSVIYLRDLVPFLSHYSHFISFFSPRFFGWLVVAAVGADFIIVHIRTLRSQNSITCFGSPRVKCSADAQKREIFFSPLFFMSMYIFLRSFLGLVVFELAGPAAPPVLPSRRFACVWGRRQQTVLLLRPAYYHKYDPVSTNPPPPSPHCGRYGPDTLTAMDGEACR